MSASLSVQMKQPNEEAKWHAKSTILDLNASISEKDSARRNYISALYNYWSLYYTLRSMTLYDFERNTMLTEDYHLLIE